MIETDPPASKKRKRPSLVCENCKKRKIKCDKKSPCAPCTKSNLEDSCSYELTFLERNSLYKKSATLPYIQSARNPIGISVKQQRVSSQSSPSKPDVVGKIDLEENVTVPKSELEFLKERLRSIEASLLNQTTNILSPKPTSASSASPTSLPDVQIPPIQPRPVPQTINQPVEQGQAQTQVPRINTNPYILTAPAAVYTNQRNGPTINENYGYPSRQTSISNSSATPVPPVSYQTPYDTPRSIDSATNSSYLNNHTTKSVPIQLPPLRWKEKEKEQFNCPELCKVTSVVPLIGVNPYGSEDETINLYENYSSVHVKGPNRKINYGPFAWSSLMKRDHGLKMLWDYMITKKENSKESNTTFIFAQQLNEITKENAQVLTAVLPKGKGYSESLETAFHKRALEPDGFGDIIPYKSMINGRYVTERTKESTLPLGLSYFEGKLGREFQLIDTLKAILPKRKVIWKLIDRYFTYLYPYMAFLDQVCFTDAISGIIGPRGYDDKKIDDIRIEKRIDLAYMGILCVLLRLTYLSLFVNKSSVNEERLTTTDPSPEAQEMKYLFLNPITVDTIDVAQLCLDQFQLLRKTSLVVLQLAFYMRLYHSYAPEDGDGADGGDSQVSSAMIIQMAYSLGLNREPSKFPDIVNNPRLDHLCRKIWKILCLSDIHQAYSFGNPMSIDKIFYDTKAPYFEEQSANIPNLELDKEVTEMFQKCGIVLEPMTKLMRILLDVEGRANMAEVCKILSKVEKDQYQQHSICASLWEAISAGNLPKPSPAQVYRRNFLIKVYMSLQAFFMSVYFHFYLYYEPKSVDLCFFYVKKMLLISTGTIMPHYFDLLGNTEYVCDFVVNPTLQLFIHKANQLNLALIIRVNYVLYHFLQDANHETRMETDPDFKKYFLAILRLSNLLKRSAEISISAISKISNRYYYAWRITKSHTYLLKTIMNVLFYRDNYHQAQQLCFAIFSFEYVDVMNSIIDVSVQRFPKVDSLAPDFISLSKSTSTTETATPNDTPKDATPANGGGGVGVDFEADFIDNKEIDLLWFQMISMKYENKDSSLRSNLGQTSASTSTSQQPPAETTQGIDVRHGFDLEELSRFDLFNDLPFDQLFAKNEFS